MYKSLVKNGTSIAFIVGFVVALFIIFTTVSGASGIRPDSFEELNQVGAFGTIVTIAIAFVIIAILAILLGGLFGLVTNPKGAIKFVIGLVGLLVLFGIAYALSGADTGAVLNVVQKEGIEGGISKMISGGLILTLLLMAVGVVAILLSEIVNAFK